MPALLVKDTTPVVASKLAVSAPLAELRTINFAKLMDRSSDEMAKLVLACQEVGFFYLDLTFGGASDMLQNHDELLDIMKAWFFQDLETKLATETVSASHGYKPTGHHAGVGDKKDGWEALKIGRTEMLGRWAMASVVKSNLDQFSEFHHECHFVTKVLLDCISSGMGLRGASSLQQYHRDDAPSKGSLFFIHYPPFDASSDEVGQNQHTDIGSLTLLFAQQWGLQVLYPSDSVCPETGEKFQWRSVEPRTGHAIINVGDTLRFLSGFRLRSALHRALPLENGVDRYSVAYFMRPSDDSEFKDVNGETTSAVNWYLRKNRTYENAGGVQDEAILVGGIKEVMANVSPKRPTVE